MNWLNNGANMKSVEIILENKEKISFNDMDDSPLEEYSEKISSLFQVSNITTLIFGGQSIILRPSKIFAIRVNGTEMELPDHLEPPTEVKEVEEVKEIKLDDNKELTSEVEEDEDVITD